MIIHDNEAIRAHAVNYNVVYAGDEHHFQHRLTFEAIDHFLDHLEDFHPASCLDIGCGQGQVLMHVADALKPRIENLDPARFVGVDLSDVAIGQCEKRRPDLAWAIDTYQNFVTHEIFRQSFGDGVDLIINKGGFTYVAGEGEYTETMQRTREALAPGGRFLFIKNRSFYEKWSRSRASYWKRDPLQIIFDTFGEPASYPNKAYYVYLFTRDGAAESGEAHPQEVEFGFEDGAQLTRGIYYDLNARRRALASAREDADGIGLTNIRLELGPDCRINPTRSIRKALGRHAQVIDIDATTRTSKSFIDQSTAYFDTPARRFVVGGSLQDWLVDPASAQTMVDPDEFAVRMNWFFKTLRDQSKEQPVFMTALPIFEGASKDGLRYSRRAAARFRDITQQCANENDVAFIDLSGCTTWHSILRETSGRKAMPPSKSTAPISGKSSTPSLAPASSASSGR